jgi:mRNA interferase MazF
LSSPLQWKVIRAGLDPVHGREQAGERPVIIISAEPLNELYEVVTVIPVTSRKGNRPARLGEVLLPAGIAGLRNDSFAICYQVRTIDKERLLSSYGHVPEGSLREEIVSMLAECLDIPR